MSLVLVENGMRKSPPKLANLSPQTRALSAGQTAELSELQQAFPQGPQARSEADHTQ